MSDHPGDQDPVEALRISRIEVAYEAVHALEAAGIHAEVWGSGSSMPAWQLAIIGGWSAPLGDHSVGPHHVMVAAHDLDRAKEVLRICNVPARPTSVGP